MFSNNSFAASLILIVSEFDYELEITLALCSELELEFSDGRSKFLSSLSEPFDYE